MKYFDFNLTCFQNNNLFPFFGTLFHILFRIYNKKYMIKKWKKYRFRFLCRGQAQKHIKQNDITCRDRYKKKYWNKIKLRQWSSRGYTWKNLHSRPQKFYFYCIKKWNHGSRVNVSEPKKYRQVFHYHRCHTVSVAGRQAGMKCVEPQYFIKIIKFAWNDPQNVWQKWWWTKRI